MCGIALTLAMSVCLVLGLLPIATFASLLPGFTAAWGLSDTEAGWISGVYYIGYVLAVPFIMSTTDRRDARPVYLCGAALSAVSTFAFAALAHGFWSALLWRAVAGIGLAGTYMPGLKILTDRSRDRVPARDIGIYTACYSFGTGVSFLLAGWVGTPYGWRMAFVAAALGPLAAMLATAALVRPAVPQHRAQRSSIIADFRRTLANRAVLGYVLAYSTHNFEAWAMRSWVVSLLVFAAARAGGTALSWSPTEIATVVTLLGVPGTVLGNELALRIGRTRAITLIMLASAAASAGVGLTAAGSYDLLVALVMLHGFLIPADAGALVAGTVTVAPAEVQGASLAVQASAGFGASFIGPLVVGVVLDRTGGASDGAAWRAAFITIAAFACLGPLALRLAALRTR
ncbi:MAG TPA: MFS transporter [Stellaceae bacterium]|nr:MFS transporter [Stellaceae bacterium]